MIIQVIFKFLEVYLVDITDIEIAPLLDCPRKKQIMANISSSKWLDSFIKWLDWVFCDGAIGGKYCSGMKMWWFKIILYNYT